jgi:hypothetical protein
MPGRQSAAVGEAEAERVAILAPENGHASTDTQCVNRCKAAVTWSIAWLLAALSKRGYWRPRARWGESTGTRHAERTACASS